MFPLRDLNPTRITPIVTVAVIAINVAVFFIWQPHDSIEDFENVYEFQDALDQTFQIELNGLNN